MKTSNKIEPINGIYLLSKDDMVVKAANDKGEFEPETFKYWLEYLKPGEVAIDVGAYTGIYSIAANNAGCYWIYSFEPNDLAYERLIANLAINECKNVHVFDCALSDQHGIKKFKRKDIPLTSSGAISQEGYDVPCRMLNSFIGTSAKVCAIKIDVEGHEYEVLKGASQVIQRSKPLIIAEFLNDEERIKVTNLLNEYRYSEPLVTDKRNLVFIP